MTMLQTICRDPRDVFDGFMRRVRNEVYSEPDSQLHTVLTDKLLPQFAGYLPDKNTRILDVGCGQGYASLKFKELGYLRITAITLSQQDVEACRDRGVDCRQMDMSFLCFMDQTFNALWVRHALEHSPFPYLTLLEFNRVLAPDGIVYIEMPGADTPRELENWPNHYSVMGTKMWMSLMLRSGFNILLNQKVQFDLQIPHINGGMPFRQENDVYILQKVRNESIA
jgi:SAM-dependent methyltransferase